MLLCKKGFTLVEVMIVTAILGILLSVVAPMFNMDTIPTTVEREVIESTVTVVGM